MNKNRHFFQVIYTIIQYFQCKRHIFHIKHNAAVKTNVKFHCNWKTLKINLTPLRHYNILYVILKWASDVHLSILLSLCISAITALLLHEGANGVVLHHNELQITSHFLPFLMGPWTSLCVYHWLKVHWLRINMNIVELWLFWWSLKPNCVWLCVWAGHGASTMTGGI